MRQYRECPVREAVRHAVSPDAGFEDASRAALVPNHQTCLEMPSSAQDLTVRPLPQGGGRGSARRPVVY